MKSFTLLFLLFAASICLTFGSAVPNDTETADECDVPAIVAYCLDMIHLGAEYEPPSATVEELKHDVEKAPLGMCPWGDWNGKATVEDCMQILSLYADLDEDNEEVEVEMDPSGRFFKKIKRGLKKIGKKVKKAVKKVARGVKKVVKKVARFCIKNKEICEKAVEIGVDVINEKHEQK